MSVDPDDGGRGRLGERLSGLRHEIGQDPALTLGVAVGAAWLILVLLFWLLGPSAADGGRGGAGWLASLAAIVLPLLLIWLAVGTHRALAGLRDEAHDLRQQLLALRTGAGGGPPAAGFVLDDGADVLAPRPAGPATRAAAANPPTATAAPRAPRPAARPPRGGSGGPARPAEAATATPQPSLDLGAPAAVEVSSRDLIAALNFPDGPDDHVTIAALRRALIDPETARLIRAAQDVVTLLAARGLYMDDQPALDVAAESWRRFAEGARGPALGGLQDAPTALSPEAEAMLGEALRGDEVFRDAAHHFLRHWDRMFGRIVAGLDDRQILDLAGTRSGRAFATLAQATGIFG